MGDSELSSRPDTVENRMGVFVAKFAGYFADALRDNQRVALKEAKVDPSKVSGAAGARALGKAVGAGGGAALGMLTGVFGAFSGVKGGTKLGKMVADKALEKKGKEQAGNVHQLLGDQLGAGAGDSASRFKAQLASLGAEIFASFEFHLSRATEKNAGWDAAMAVVARDAVDRIFGEIRKMKEEKEPSRAVLLKALVEGKSKGFFHKGEELREVRAGKEEEGKEGEKLFTGWIFEKPGILLSRREGEGGGESFEAFSQKESDVDRYWYRLAFDHESELLRDREYARRVKNPDLERYRFQVLNWDRDKLETHTKKIIAELRDVDEKVSDLEKLFTESTEEILKGQQEMKAMLTDLDTKMAVSDRDAAARDLRTQNLILHQGLEIKNMLRNKDAGGQGAAAEQIKLGKWWPREQILSKNFLARSADDGQPFVERLRATLEKEKAAAAGDVGGRGACALVLVGMGGVGKTTTMKWYSGAFANRYAHVVWLDAEGEQLSKSVRELATALFIPIMLNDGVTLKGLPALSADIAKELSDVDCLFLFDNVDDEEAVMQVVSPSRRHHSLITSRLQRWKHLPTVEVGLFTHEEAKAFLAENIPKTKHSGRKQLESLTEVLQRLPLAMNQAVACMEQLCLTVAEYLSEFARKVSSVLGFGGDSRQKTVLTTWGVSIEKMAGDPSGELAHRILKSVAYLYPDGIPRELLAELGEGAGRFELARAMDLLQMYSLVKINRKGELSLHRLVQETMRVTLEKEDPNMETLSRVLRTLLRKIAVNYHDNPLVTHLRSAAKFIPEAEEEKSTSWDPGQRRRWDLLRLDCQETEAMVLLVDKKFDQALEMQIANVDRCRDILGSTGHQRYLLSLAKRVNVHIERVNHGWSYLFLNEIREKLENKHGDLHADAITLHYLQGYLRCKRKWPSQALPDMRSVLRKQQVVSAAFSASPHLVILARMTQVWARLASERNADQGLAEVHEARSQLTSGVAPPYVTRMLSQELSGDDAELATARHLFVKDVVRSIGAFQEAEKGEEENVDLYQRRQDSRILAFLDQRDRIRNAVVEIFGYPEGGVFGMEFVSVATHVETGILNEFVRSGFDEMEQLLQLIREKRIDLLGEEHELSLELDNLLAFVRAMRADSASAMGAFESVAARAAEDEDSCWAQQVVAHLGRSLVLRTRGAAAEESGLAIRAALEILLRRDGEQHATTKLLQGHLKDMEDPDQLDMEDPDLLFDDHVQGFEYAVVQAESLDLLEYLLEKHGESFDFRTKNADGNTALHFVASKANQQPEMLKVLVKKLKSRYSGEALSAVADEKNAKGYTALMNVVVSGAGADAVREVLSMRPDPDAAESINNTALHKCVSWDNMAALEEMLRYERRPDVKLLNNNEQTLLYLCSNRTEMAEKILKHAKEVLAPEEYKKFVNTPDYWGYNPLMTAVDGRNISLAKILHAEGSDILALEKNGKGILHICAENGDVESTSWCLSQGAPVNCVDDEGDTPLSYAAQWADLAYNRFLVEKGADFVTHSAAVLQRALEKGGEMLELHLSLLRDRFAGDLDGLRSAVNAGDHAARDTPFMQAVWAVQAEAARVLLRSGADVNAANAAGRRALHHSACPRQEGNEEEKDQVKNSGASSSVDDEIFRILVEAGAEFDAEDAWSETAVFQAAKNDREDFLGKCLERGESVTKRNAFGESLLHLLVHRHNVGMVKALLDHANERGDEVLTEMVNGKDHSELTPYLTAVKTGNDTIQTLLLPLTKDKGGWEEIHVAALKGDAEEIERMLEQAGEDDEMPKTERGRTPLLIAAEHGKVPVLELLLSRGPPPSSAALLDDGRSVAHLAAASGVEDAFVAMEDALGAEQAKRMMRSADAAGRTPLMEAVGRQKAPMVEFLLGRGVDPNCRDSSGRSALDLAVGFADAGAVKTLLEAGARRKAGRTSGAAGQPLPTKIAKMLEGAEEEEEEEKQAGGTEPLKQGYKKKERKKSSFCALL